MANLFYKDHLITVVGRTDQISQFWIPVADISWEADGQRESHTITGGLDWVSNWQDVERHGRTRESMGGWVGNST